MLKGKRKISIVSIALVLVLVLSGCGTVKVSDGVRDKYEGDWYGWLYVSDATGVYQSLKDVTWDICGNISFVEEKVDGKNREVANANLWNYEDSSKQYVSFLTIINDDDTWSAGEAYLYGEQCSYISHGYVSQYNDLLTIDFKVDFGDDTMTANLTIRKWGETWDDVKENDPSFLPLSYEKWYVPIITEGGNMPK